MTLNYCLKLFLINKNKILTREFTKMVGPIETAIENALQENLQPVHVEIINESFMHNVPKGSESHFKVLVVSEKFEKLPLIKRHRIINEIIKNQLKNNFPHALSIVAKTKAEWSPDSQVEKSPKCLGGFGK